MIKSRTSDWREWIEHNLSRKCTVSSMLEAMTAKGFEADFAAAFIADVQQGNDKVSSGQLSMGRSPDGFEYEPSRVATGSFLNTSDRAISVRMRIQEPEILLLDGVLSSDECDELVNRSKEKLSPSTTVDKETGEMKVIRNRTSCGTFFHLEEDDFIARLDKRLAEIANWPLDHAEGLQILNYRLGGEYRPHFDFFPPKDLGSAAHTSHGGQRVATIIIYLNDVEEGGETIFPKLSLSVPPRKGNAVYFAYHNSKGQVDERTLHGGAPVLKGEKWIATKWMRQNRRR
jgi:prolyl 4-hydroxylase